MVNHVLGSAFAALVAIFVVSLGGLSTALY